MAAALAVERGLMKNGLSLPEKAYRLIKQLFVADQLVGGQKLRYQELAERFKMSQTPVIQALTRLEVEGLVRSEANKGYFVHELNSDEAEELYDLRLLIELHLAPKAVANMDKAGLDKLAGLMKDHHSARSAVYRRERLICDANIHIALAGLSGNKTATDILRRIFDSLFLKFRAETLTNKRLHTSEKEHEDLFKALGRSDTPLVLELLERHVRNGRDHVVGALLTMEAKTQSMEL